jgi:ABC-2 type transport system permease protein
VVGIFLGMDKIIEDFPVYIFSAMVLVNFFNDTLHSAVRSVTGNAPLVRKVYLPREMFPAASLIVSAVHLAPGMVIVLIGALWTGWTPSVLGLLAGLLGFAIVAVLGMGLGLLVAALNVYYRDLEQGVDVLTILTTWSVPMIYPWLQVRDHAPGWGLELYLANPLVTAVSLFHKAFWYPQTRHDFEFPPNLWLYGFASLAGAFLVLWIGQRVFARLSPDFASEL